MNQNAAKTSLTNELAKERNRKADDRTLMAWIRTAISLIGFGFAIAKSYEYIETDYMEETGRALDALHTPVIFGVSFIVLGMLGIFGGVIQYGRNIKRINSDQFTYIEPWPLPKILAILLLVIAVFGLAAILL
jgi:putative membrane protein